MSNENKVPPAGNVEVLAWRVAVEGHSTKYHEHAVLVEDALKHHARFGRAVEVVELVDRAHVTHLTQELERSQAGGQLLVRDCDDLQAQLTQALECISAIGRLAFNNGATIYSAAPSFIIDIRNALYAYADAPEPAGKCDSCGGNIYQEAPATTCEACTFKGKDDGAV
jgi:hypothetical protein